MSAKKPCPICQDQIDQTARTVTVNGIAYDVWCEECAHQARANPKLLKSARRA